MTPTWLTLAIVNSLHAQSVAKFGGAAGLRDQGLLESALDRPRNLHTYGDEPTLFELAAAYCAGIVGNLPYVDGNKRAGVLAANAFLELNGYVFDPPEVDVVNVIMALAAGELDDAALAVWFSDYSMRTKT